MFNHTCKLDEENKIIEKVCNKNKTIDKPDIETGIAICVTSMGKNIEGKMKNVIRETEVIKEKTAI